MRVLRIGIFYLSYLCVGRPAIWRGQSDGLYLNDIHVKIKGINWYGFETTKRCIEGLWENPVSYYLQYLHEQKFNALRIPISEDMVLYDNAVILPEYIKAEPRALNATPVELLDIIFQDAAEHNMIILLDIHRLKYGLTTPFWYIPDNSNYTVDTIIFTMDQLIQRYSTYPNFLGIDLYNEPHYNATYGSGDETDWKVFIEQCVSTLFPRYPERSFFFFVNGIDWGKNLTHYGSNAPAIDPQYTQRIILSPHVYGPTLNYIPSLEKNALYALWDVMFGYLKSWGFPLCIGEWGGVFGKKDEKRWLQTFAQYLIDNNMTDNFFWALNPFSKDVGGLMKNWTVWYQHKLDFLANIQKEPSVFVVDQYDIYVAS